MNKRILLTLLPAILVGSFATSCKMEKISDYANVIFNEDFEGGKVEVKSVKKGEKVEKIADPTRTGYTFNGWKVSSDDTSADYNFDTAVSDNLTLYGSWTLNEVAPTEVTKEQAREIILNNGLIPAVGEIWYRKSQVEFTEFSWTKILEEMVANDFRTLMTQFLSYNGFALSFGIGGGGTEFDELFSITAEEPLVCSSKSNLLKLNRDLLNAEDPSGFTSKAFICLGTMQGVDPIILRYDDFVTDDFKGDIKILKDKDDNLIFSGDFKSSTSAYYYPNTELTFNKYGIMTKAKYTFKEDSPVYTMSGDTKIEMFKGKGTVVFDLEY